MSLRNKLLKTKELLSEVFLHDEYYVDSVLSAFASDSHICLLGFRGSGKTHLMECLVKMIDSNTTSIVQGYLTAEIEDIFARPNVSSLINGKEEVIWRKVVNARVKAFDEIQRLGVGALSTMFRLMTKGSVIYFDQEQGIKPFWIISTANPTELESDMLNIRLPEPLLDRFDAVIWIPVAPLKYQSRIDSTIEDKKEKLPKIWSDSELVQLWKEVEQVKIEERESLIITLINRLLGFCRYAQNYDASSLSEQQKRAICSKCNKSYICSLIARPPSVRAKLSLAKLSKGFAYLRGSDKVELQDIANAFPLVYWKRIKLMNDSEVTNRLESLRELYQKIINEIKEARQPLELISELKEAYDVGKYSTLENWCNSKVWLIELKEDLDEYYTNIYRQLKEISEKAKQLGDKVTLMKVYKYAQAKLPHRFASEFEKVNEIEIELTPEKIAELTKISLELFNEARKLYESGIKKMTLKGEYAIKYMELFSGE
jgi:MoxR-like ATPase